MVVDENTSDGYHTFKELYQFRLLYNAALFNLWGFYTSPGSVKVWRSKKHSDGTKPFGDGWFIAGAELPDIGQISNHYEMKDWDLFYNVPTLPRAPKWDGHSPADVAERLRLYLTGVPE